MDVINATLLVISVIPAASYAWGMRGTTIGGEKGAMLPGAVIGGLLAIFSNILIVREHFYIFSALGAIGMYFGGCMTYGETLSFSMSARPAVNMKKGLIALILKGFLWFGSFGVVFSTGVNAVSGKYSLPELIAMFVITPISALVLHQLFNSPHNVDENIYPRFYFSKKRKEYWGSVLGIFISLYGFGILNVCAFNVIFPVICGLFGGVGWVLGQLMHIYSKHYADESNGLLGKLLSESRGIGGWKAMECILGGFGGLGAALGLILSYDSFREITLGIELNSGPHIFSNKANSVLLILWLLLLICDIAHYFVNAPVEEKHKKIWNIYNCTIEPSEFIIYAAFPFINICLGGNTVAEIFSFFIIYWVLIQEICFENCKFTKHSLIAKIPLVIIGVIILILQLSNVVVMNYKITFILYTIVYEALTLFYFYPAYKKNIIKRLPQNGNTLHKIKCAVHHNDIIIFHGYFIFSIAVTLCII